MRNATRLKRLKMLHHMLKNHHKIFPHTRFDMRIWGEFAYKGDDCATAACALGSAACYPPFRKLGLKLRHDKSSTYNIYPVFKGLIQSEAGAEFFGLALHEADDLFLSAYYLGPKQITRNRVATKVARLIKHYERNGDSGYKPA